MAGVVEEGLDCWVEADEQWVGCRWARWSHHSEAERWSASRRERGDEDDADDQPVEQLTTWGLRPVQGGGGGATGSASRVSAAASRA